MVIQKVYQKADGSFLPSSSHPTNDIDWHIDAKDYTPHQSTRYVNVSNKIRKQPLPELYTKRSECCACTSCISVCPCNAIEMRPDEEGFEYPVVDADKCISCYKCVKICPYQL